MFSLTNIVRRPRGFRGGVFLPRPTERAPVMPVQALADPPVLFVLMRQHEGSPATVCVEPGQTVHAGQRIGQAQEPEGLHVHSPVAGRVVAIARADSARLTDVPAVQIEPLVREGIPAPAPAVAAPATAVPVSTTAVPTSAMREAVPPPAATLAHFIDAAEHAGLTDFQPRPGSLPALLRSAAGHVSHVIINTLPGEPVPFMPALDLDRDLQTIVRTGCNLGQMLHADRIWLTADRVDSGTLSRMRKVTRGTAMRVVGLANKYPQHVPVLLAAAIAGVETPPGRTPLDIGVLVLEWRAVLALAAAIGAPASSDTYMTHVEISVSGPAVLRPGCYRVPIGTPIEHILRQVGLRATVRRVIDGGPMTGQAVNHLGVVVTKRTSSLIGLDRTGEHVPSPGPCIRCGWCQEDCPVGLEPQALLDAAERGRWSAGRRLHPDACVECGLCSYICPAELPLAEGVARVRKACESGDL